MDDGARSRWINRPAARRSARRTCPSSNLRVSMKDPVESVPDTSIGSQDKQTDKSRHEVFRALQLILKSPSFRNSERCKQFLKYVVENSIERRSEFLKERSIGIEV